jgi:thymidylate synthase (FAD)
MEADFLIKSSNQEQLDEILSQKPILTKRPTVESLENILFSPIKILDHGFIRVIDYMGDDSAIVQSARVSYGAGTKQISKDKALIFYLMRHSHTTPFEMCEIKFHIKLPIFIARQWIRHRTASVNEYSARYSIMNKEFYIPAKENLCTQSLANKQGRDKILNEQESAIVLQLLKDDASRCYENYEYMLNEDLSGNQVDLNRSQLSRELARMNLNLNYYTEWYWKIDLHNLFHFLRLRADSHAQFEIQEYANAMLNVVKQWVPIAYEAFIEYKKESASFSKTALLFIKNLILGGKLTQEESGLNKREYEEVIKALKL